MERQIYKQMVSEAERQEYKEPETDSERLVQPGLEKLMEPKLEKRVEQGPEKKVEPELEKGVEPELEKGVEPELEKGVGPELEKGVGPELEKGVEPELEKRVESELEKQVEQKPEKQVEPELEKPVEPELEKPVESVLEIQAKPAADKSLNQMPEKAPEDESNKPEPESVKPEQNRDQVLDVTQASSFAPDSLGFAFLEEESTKMALYASRTLFILRGLPGSGKSQLATAISVHYPDLCTIVSADEHNVRPEQYGVSADEHRALDATVVSCCTAGKAVVVVDDTNHTRARLARLGELAEEHRYFALFLEPRTEWRRDVEQLARRTRRGLDKSQIQALRGSLEETSLPLYFGWFLHCTFRDELEGMAKNFLKMLGTLDAFKERLHDFTGDAENEMDLEQFFQDTGPRHCTTKFCDYGKAQGAVEYADEQAVRQEYGSMTELELRALFVTPRTMGARVALTPEQLRLWPEDEPEADLPRGSRAHVTLGCAERVDLAQTGMDLLAILRQQGHECQVVQVLEQGPLAYYGNGVWVLSLPEPHRAPALFSSFYGPKEEEEVQKKKSKCTIL